MTERPLCLFALHTTAKLGAAVGSARGARIRGRRAQDTPARGCARRRRVRLQGLHGEAQQSANDKLCRLLFFIATLKDAGAAHVTVLAPYLCYAHKDRRTKPGDPVTMRYLASLFEAVGTDAFVTLDVHNPAAKMRSAVPQPG